MLLRRFFSSSAVRIVEVGARDGLQNEKMIIPTQTKIGLLERLASSGLKRIEASSFVSAKWIPQLADAEEVMRAVLQSNKQKSYNVTFSALTPNIKGYERAVSIGVKEVAVFTAASESFCQKNINCSISQSIERFDNIFRQAKTDGVRVRGYVSCISSCPYEGRIDAAKVNEITLELLDRGCFEVSLGDTIGLATPQQIKLILKSLDHKINIESQIALHCHDTFGFALANCFAAFERGVRVFDSSVAGLGGCPYAGEGASGNVATEDLIFMLSEMGVETGVDLDAVIEAGRFITNECGLSNRSRVSKSNLRHDKDRKNS